MINKIHKENKVWFILIPVLVIGTIYGLLAQNLIDNSFWKDLIYSNKFASIQPKHLSLWSSIILVNVISMLIVTKMNTKYRLVYKLYVVLATAAFGMWFIFDAFTRGFDTLPDVASQLSGGDITTVIMMSMFEIILGSVMIKIALYLGWRITNKYTIKRSKKVDKLFIVTGWTAISVYSLVFISQLLVYISYHLEGVGSITDRRWPNIGPDSQGLIALIGVLLAWKRIKSIKHGETLNQWKFTITTTFIFALLTALMFHDNCIFIYDYVSDAGRYNVAQIWGSSGFVDFSTWLLIITIPLLMGLIVMYLIKLTSLIIYLAPIKLTKKEKKILKKAN